MIGRYLFIFKIEKPLGQPRRRERDGKKTKQFNDLIFLI